MWAASCEAVATMVKPSCSVPTGTTWASGKPTRPATRFITVLPTTHRAWLEPCSWPKKFKEMPQPRRDLLLSSPHLRRADCSALPITAMPAVPMAKTVACLNFESIGPAELTRDVVILGGGESDLDHYYEAAAAARAGISISTTTTPTAGFSVPTTTLREKGRACGGAGEQPSARGASKPNKYPMPVWYHKPCLTGNTTIGTSVAHCPT